MTDTTRKPFRSRGCTDVECERHNQCARFIFREECHNLSPSLCAKQFARTGRRFAKFEAYSDVPFHTVVKQEIWMHKARPAPSVPSSVFNLGSSL